MAKELTLNLAGFGENMVFALVDPKSLKIDRNYQRDQTELVQWIGENFDPLAFGYAYVGQRANGDRYLVDGQQRTAGAIIAKIALIPILIFKSEGREHEAKIFRFLNQFRKPVSMMDIFRASVTEGEPTAVAIDNAVKAAGFLVAHKKGLNKKWPYIGAVDQIRKIYEADGAIMLTAVLTMIGKLWPDQYEGLWKESIRGVYVFIKTYGAVLDVELLVQQFEGVPMATIGIKASTEKARQKAVGQTRHMYQCIFTVMRGIYARKIPDVVKAWPVDRDKAEIIKGLTFPPIPKPAKK